MSAGIEKCKRMIRIFHFHTTLHFVKASNWILLLFFVLCSFYSAHNSYVLYFSFLISRHHSSLAFCLIHPSLISSCLPAFMNLSLQTSYLYFKFIFLKPNRNVRTPLYILLHLKMPNF